MKTLLKNEIFRHGFIAGSTGALLLVLVVFGGYAVGKAVMKAWKSGKQSAERRAYLEAKAEAERYQRLQDYFRKVENSNG